MTIGFIGGRDDLSTVAVENEKHGFENMHV
jgi:hypothetical protein